MHISPFHGLFLCRLNTNYNNCAKQLCPLTADWTTTLIDGWVGSLPVIIFTKKRKTQSATELAANRSSWFYISLRISHVQSETRSWNRDEVCLQSDLWGKGKGKGYSVSAFHNMTPPFPLGRSEQFARLDNAESFSSSVDFVSLKLSFPHSPFLSAVFCDQC